MSMHQESLKDWITSTHSNAHEARSFGAYLEHKVDDIEAANKWYSVADSLFEALRKMEEMKDTV